jgi:hypothetical protein
LAWCDAKDVTVPMFLALRRINLAADEVVTKEGELGREMYIVVNGALSLHEFSR